MNWTRAQLKIKAKAVIKTNYLKFLLASFVLLVAGVNSCNIGTSAGRSSISSSDMSYYDSVFTDESTVMLLLTGLLITLLITMVVVTVFSVFVAFPLSVGAWKIFIETSNGDTSPNFQLLKRGFAKGNYLNTVWAGFLREIYIFLWSLLFVIPGIVKSYAYYFVPFIMADNPGIKASRAIELSKKMTQGHKLNMFILNLSFMGWYLLGALALGVGVFFVMPYDNATHAQLYVTIRNDMLDNSLLDADEFSLVVSKLEAERNLQNANEEI